MPLDATVTKALDEWVEVGQWIDVRTHVLDIPGDACVQIAAACFDIVLEHQMAIATLVKSELCGSALAFLRVIAEAYIRGEWFKRCGTPAVAESFRGTDFIRSGGIDALVKDVEADLGHATDTLSNIVKDQWGPLSGFTHTGFLQITRRYSGPLLKPNYPSAEILQGLRFATTMGFLAALGLAHLSDNLKLAAEIVERMRQIVERAEAAGIST
jgi:hypothetical protein